MTSLSKLPSPGEAAAAFLRYHAEDAARELASLRGMLLAQTEFDERGTPQPYIEAKLELTLKRLRGGQPALDNQDDVLRAVEVWVAEELFPQGIPRQNVVSIRKRRDSDEAYCELDVRVSLF